MKGLTQRQQQVFDFICSQIESSGMPPTRVEIANYLSFRSANAAEEHLKALAKKGWIEMIPGASRGLRVLKKTERDELPLIGKVAAGAPILAQAHIESQYRLAPNMFKPAADFLLRVEGMSMKDIGILDGDLLAVHKTEDIRNGQVVVVRVEDEVTVKRWERVDNRVILHPENSEFDPIKIDLTQSEVTIEGLVVGVLRSQVH
jgi:repressor LexA